MLEVEGQPIISHPQFAELMRNMSDDGPPIGPLAAWLVGEPVTPADIYYCVQIAARIHAGDNEHAHQLLDLIASELERRFPDDLG